MNDHTVPLLEDTGRGIFLQYRGKTLMRGEPSETAALKKVHLFAENENLDATLILCPSPLSGTALLELLRLTPESCHILAMEADPHLLKLLEEKIIPSQIKKAARFSLVSIKPDTTPRDKDSALSHWLKGQGTYFPWRRVKTLSLTAGGALNRPSYQWAHQFLEERMQEHWRNRVTLIHFGRRWIQHIFQNLSLAINNDGVSGLTDAVTAFQQQGIHRRPVLVLGAGESLELNQKEIAAAKQNGWYLLAVDTALPFLRETGIFPHGVVALESQQVNMEDFLFSRDPRNHEIHLFADITSLPSINRLFRNHLTLFATPFFPLTFFSRLQAQLPSLGTVPPAGSVGLTALHLAKKLTEGAVSWIGLDFSYRHGKTHARGTAYTNKALLETKRIHPLGQTMWNLTQERGILNLGPSTTEPFTKKLSHPALHSFYLNLENWSARDDQLIPWKRDLLSRYSEEIIPSSPQPKASQSKAFHLFLKQEDEFLLEGINRLREGGKDWHLSAEALDYAYSFFPDAPRAESLSEKQNLPEDLRKRLLLSLYSFRSGLNRSFSTKT